LQFFSKDTHTIYQPKIEVKWDDSTYSPDRDDNNPISASEDIEVHTSRLRGEYHIDSKPKIRVEAMEMYVQKTYVTSFQTASGSFLPSSSCYAIVDAHTNEKIVDFDDTYTKISCDSNNGYFNFWMEQLEPERYYRIAYKVKDADGTIDYYKDKNVFKVIDYEN